MKHRPQPRIPGVHRIPRGTSLLPALERALQREADRFGVSKSHVLASMAAFLLDVEEQPDYKEPPARRGLRLVKKRA